MSSLLPVLCSPRVAFPGNRLRCTVSCNIDPRPLVLPLPVRCQWVAPFPLPCARTMISTSPGHETRHWIRPGRGFSGLSLFLAYSVSEEVSKNTDSIIFFELFFAERGACCTVFGLFPPSFWLSEYINPTETRLRRTTVPLSLLRHLLSFTDSNSLEERPAGDVKQMLLFCRP